MPAPNTPYSFIRQGQLFIIPVGPSIAEVDYPTYGITKPREYSQWVRGKIDENVQQQLDRGRMTLSLYQDVRDDVVKFAPVEVTRSVFRKSGHAFVGVIDSKGKPYYFALDSLGISVRPADVNDEKVWKTFDALATAEQMTAVRARRGQADAEMREVDRELSEPSADIVKAKIPYGPKTKYRGSDTPAATWLHGLGTERTKQRAQPREKKIKEPKPTVDRDQAHLHRYETRLRGRQAIRDKLRAERQAAKPPKAPRASRAKKPKDTEVDMPTQKSEPALVIVLGVEKSLGWREHTEGHEAHASHGTYQVTEHGAHYRPNNGRWDRVSPNKKGISQDQLKVHAERHHAKVVSITKALPRKSKEEPVKKTPTKKATAKKTGATGNTRYSYPNEKKKAKKPGAGKTPSRQPLVVAADHDDTRHADPEELANQLNVSVRTIKRVARRLGREGFSKFMRSHLKRFAAKHRLDPDYWNTLYEKLRATGLAGSDEERVPA